MEDTAGGGLTGMSTPCLGLRVGLVRLNRRNHAAVVARDQPSCWPERMVLDSQSIMCWEQKRSEWKPIMCWDSLLFCFREANATSVQVACCGMLSLDFAHLYAAGFLSTKAATRSSCHRRDDTLLTHAVAQASITSV